MSKYDHNKRQEGTNPKDLIGAKKAPLDLVPPALLIGAAQALGDGAAKYGPYNWREYRVQSMTYLGAALRHIMAFIDGEDVATDSGVSHLAHVVASMAILMDAFGNGYIEDNRPPVGPASKLLREQDASITVRSESSEPGFSEEQRQVLKFLEAGRQEIHRVSARVRQSRLEQTREAGLLSEQSLEEGRPQLASHSGFGHWPKRPIGHDTPSMYKGGSPHDRKDRHPEKDDASSDDSYRPDTYYGA